jgi:hypothetical protein
MKKYSITENQTDLFFEYTKFIRGHRIPKRILEWRNG